MIVHSVECNPNTAFMVSYSEGALPPERRKLGSEALLDDSCDGAVRNVQSDGDVEKQRESIKLGAIPGKQVLIDFPKKNGRMIVRIFLFEQRLYVALALGKGYSPEHENVKRFFSSFEILEKSAAPPAFNPEPRPPIAPKVPAPEIQAPDSGDPNAPVEMPFVAAKSISGINVRPVTLGAGSSAPCLCWAEDAKAFYHVDGDGVVRRVSYPELKVEATNNIGKKCKWISLSSMGLVATVLEAQEAWLLDPTTLKESAMIPIGTAKWVVSSPKIAHAYAIEPDPANDHLTVLDLKAGMPLKHYRSWDVERTSFSNAIISPDGKYLFTSFHQIYRTKLDGEKLAPAGRSDLWVTGATGLSMSTAGDFICAPGAGRDGTDIFSTGNLRRPLWTIKYGRMVGFDVMSGLIYSQNLSSPLIIVNTKGIKLKEFPLENTKNPQPSISQFLVHPSGGRFVAVSQGTSIVYAVELVFRAK